MLLITAAEQRGASLFSQLPTISGPGFLPSRECRWLIFRSKNSKNSKNSQLRRPMAPYARRGCASLGLPSKDQADVAGHTTRILEHLGPEVEAEWPEVLMPEFVSGLGAALQSLFPLGLRIIDSPAVVAA